MIRAVLFDMDDTLLSINLGAFMTRYVWDLAKITSRISRSNRTVQAAALSRATLAMSDEHRLDSETNERVFCDRFQQLTGIPLDDPTVIEPIKYYEHEILPQRNSFLIGARPREGARECIDRAREMGLVVALATNPACSRQCILTRLGWAGLSADDFALVSHWGNATRLKPRARYFQEFVAELGLVPEECLMVGNDAQRDLPRPDIGLRTAYVGHGNPKRAAWRGSMSELAEDLPVLIDKINTADAARR